MNKKTTIACHNIYQIIPAVVNGGEYVGRLDGGVVGAADGWLEGTLVGLAVVGSGVGDFVGLLAAASDK